MHLVMPFDKLETTTNQETSTSVATRARLNFDTSLTGDDLLRIRLQGSQGNALLPFAGLNNAGSADSTYGTGRLMISIIASPSATWPTSPWLPLVCLVMIG